MYLKILVKRVCDRVIVPVVGSVQHFERMFVLSCGSASSFTAKLRSHEKSPSLGWDVGEWPNRSEYKQFTLFLHFFHGTGFATASDHLRPMLGTLHLPWYPLLAIPGSVTTSATVPPSILKYDHLSVGKPKKELWCPMDNPMGSRHNPAPFSSLSVIYDA